MCVHPPRDSSAPAWLPIERVSGAGDSPSWPPRCSSPSPPPRHRPSPTITSRWRATRARSCSRGDIVLGGAINAFAAKDGAAALLGEVPELREADLAIANLESVATSRDLSRVDKGGLVPLHFRARPETLGVLDAAGIDLVATANNHAGDYGPDAEPSEEKRVLGRRLLELGADAILGTNAHVLQGVEAHADGVIVHDAGHLLADFAQPVDTAIFTFSVSQGGVESVEATPLVADAGRARRPSPPEAVRIIDDLTRKSAALGVDLDDGRLALIPDPSRPDTMPADLVAPSSGVVPSPARTPPAGCVAAAVPGRARITPRDLGPLTLVGFGVDDDRTYLPGLVWVDTYWRVDEPIDDELWIAVTGTDDGNASSAWTTHHEPCDWAGPTSRWRPGVIYHDRSALRPPAGIVSADGAARIATGVLGALDVTVGVSRDGDELARSGRLGSVGLGAPLAIQLLVGAGVAALGLTAGRLAWRRQQRKARTERGH